ncbi:hypothetical protein D3C76_1815930 [compost metagenome]
MRQLQVAGDAGQADDMALPVAQGELVGQAPDGLVAVVEMEFKLVGQLATAGQYPPILFGV